MATFLALGALLASSGCALDRPRVEVDGSSTVYPITEAVVEEFQKENREVMVTVGVSGTGGGFQKFCTRQTAFTGASRPIKEAEQELCATNDVDMVSVTITIDALAVVVNPANDWVPQDCITVEQLNTMWRATSDVRTWQDVDPTWPAIEVKFYSPGHDSGTFDYFTEAINGTVGNSRTGNVLFSEDDNMLVHGVSGDRGALGYFGFAYYEENRHQLKALAVDEGDGCVHPSRESVEQDRYHPLARPLFLYASLQALEQPQSRDFLRFYAQSANVLAPEAGYIPLPEDQLAETLAIVERVARAHG